jgi:hypothetical protein
MTETHALQFTAGQNNSLLLPFTEGTDYTGNLVVMALAPDNESEAALVLTTNGGGIVVNAQGVTVSITSGQLAALGFTSGRYKLISSSSNSVDIVAVNAPVVIV